MTDDSCAAVAHANLLTMNEAVATPDAVAGAPRGFRDAARVQRGRASVEIGD